MVDVSGLGREAFLVSRPDHIQQTLVADDDRFVKPGFERQFVDRAFGDSLAFVDGDLWRVARELSQPAFTMDRIERYGETMVAAAEAMVDEWPATGTVTIDDELRALTFRVLARTLFDLDTAIIPDLHDDFEAVARKLRPANAVVPDWPPTTTNRRYSRALARLEATIDDLVAQRQLEGADGEDLLSMLVAANAQRERSLSRERLRDEMMGFLFAGHETTAMALTFTCHLLAANPGVQSDLRAEIASVLDGDPPSVATVAEFDLLDRVIDESLRLYPPNHMIPREPVAAITLGSYRIPAGASVYCSQWVVHRDPRWWSAPTVFRPARWADETPDRPECAFFPFGGGRRHCIGMRFARLELRLALAHILSTHRFTGMPSGDPSLAAGLTLQPAEPIELAVERDSADIW